MAPNQPTDAATLASGKPTGTAAATDAQIGPIPASATTAPESTATTGPYSLAIHDSYPLDVANGVLGQSLTASPGKVWIGSLFGTIEEVDSQSGAFGQSIPLTGTGASTTNIYPIIKLGFDGQTLWALGGIGSYGSDKLFSIDPGSGMVAREWDLTQWNLDHPEHLRGNASDFGLSPGKIWLKNQVVDTQTFEGKFVGFDAVPQFAYNGKGWMWMVGSGPPDCDGLDLINTDNPSQDLYQCRFPFLNRSENGSSNLIGVSPLVLAGDRVWIGGGWAGKKPIYTLDAFTADVDQLMKETKPLASVPLLDDPQKIKLLYAGNTLWLLWLRGEQAGFLFQLDPQTGATISSLDLTGEQVNVVTNDPMDIATEGDNLWVLTTGQLLRIKLP
jgi:hypothetical protein